MPRGSRSDGSGRALVRTPQNTGLRSARGMASAAVLALAGVALAGLCFREAAVRALAPTTPVVMRIAATHPDVVLRKAKLDLVEKNGILDTATLDATRRAATQAPLDARPFLILGHQQLLDRQPERAVRTLEMAQRLDPRERLTHLLLVDRYLRTARYVDTAEQFSVLARLMGQSEGVIPAAVAEMTRIPETRDAVRRTLRTDPALERAVLRALAKSQTPPADIFALASPAAQRDAGQAESWGPMLIARLVEQGRYADARRVWQRVYRLSDAQVAAPLFNSRFAQTTASPPFDWTFVASSIGAADPRGGTLAIDYYGRDSGTLASQLLTLGAGTYRFGFTIEGSKAADGPALFWSLRCKTTGTTTSTTEGAEILRMPVAGTGQVQKVAANFTVPAGCPAQQLALVGQAGEFPVAVTVTLRDLTLSAGASARP